MSNSEEGILSMGRIPQRISFTGLFIPQCRKLILSEVSLIQAEGHTSGRSLLLNTICIKQLHSGTREHVLSSY